MKTIVLYHNNCADGMGAAWAVNQMFDDCKCIPVNYGQPVPEVPDESQLIIVDFSYPAKIMEELEGRMSQLTVLDHHATAQREMEKFKPAKENTIIKFDMDKSGAMIAWEHFHPTKGAPEFIKYIQDRDLWRFELPSSKEFSSGLRSYEWSLEFFDTLTTDASVELMISEGLTCLRLMDNQVKQALRNVGWAMFNFSDKPSVAILKPEYAGYGKPSASMKNKNAVVPCLNVTQNLSECGHQMLKKYKDAPFSATYFDRNDGKRQWSLRSGDDFDSSVVAKAMGGGGHPKASGFEQVM